MFEEFVRRLDKLEKLVERIKASAVKPSYDSGWFAVAANSNYAQAHGLGAIPRRYVVLASTSSGGATATQVAPSVFYVHASSGYAGFRIGTLNSTSLTVVTHAYTHIDGTWQTSGYYRVIAGL